MLSVMFSVVWSFNFFLSNLKKLTLHNFSNIEKIWLWVFLINSQKLILNNFTKYFLMKIIMWTTSQKIVTSNISWWKETLYKNVFFENLTAPVWNKYLYIRIYSNIFRQIYSFRLNIYWFCPRQIYLDIHSWSIYTYEYIRIFIHLISMIANIFEFSLFPKNVLKWLLLVQNR